MTAPEAAAFAPDELTRRSRSNFSLSFVFLSRERRRAMDAVYTFCRAADDAVDEAPDAATGRERLAFWRAELEDAATGSTTPRTPIGREVAHAIGAFGVRPEHLRAVCDGCAMDLAGTEYADLTALEGYCARVASAVGLACLPIFGVEESVAGRYADRLGKALQLTNILRDVRADAELGRCYVPRDALEAAGVERAWLDGSGPSHAYTDAGPVHRLVEGLVAVARERFEEARAALPADAAARRRLLPAEVMGAVYAALLDRVAARRGRIDRPERLRIGKLGKVLLALRTWWRGQRP